MNKIKAIHLLVMLCLIAGTAIDMQAQVTWSVKSGNSLWPAKRDVKAVEEGIENVRKRIDSKESARDIAAGIADVEAQVEKIRRDFRNYKKLPEWDAAIEECKAENEKIRAAEEEERAAQRKKDNAVFQIKDVLTRTGVERDVESYRSNPRPEKGEEVVKGYSLLAQGLEKFRADYPGETENEVIRRAIDVETFVTGPFFATYMKGLKAEEEKDYKVIEEHRQSSPDRAINVLRHRLDNWNRRTAAFPDEAWFKEAQQKDRNTLADIEDYRDNGEYERWKADQVRIKPAKSRDAKAESDIRNALEEDGYEVLVVNITDDRWFISKNEYGIPEYTYVDVNTGVRKDGKCYRIYGQYRKTYAGGGTYAHDGYFRWFDPKLMNCKNCK